MVYDVAVVGLGPAGVSALKALEDTGLKVLAIEQASSFPRRKPCAGGLTPKAYRVLKELFPEIDSVVRKTASRFLTYNGNCSVVLSSSSVLTYLTQREELDYFLFNSLNHSRFDIHTGETALSTELDEGKIVLRTNRDSYRARALLVADGVNSRIARQLGVKRDIGFTFESYVESSCGDLIIDFTDFSWGYYWAFPKGDVVTTGLGEFKNKRIIADLKNILANFNRKHGFTSRMVWRSGFPIPAGKRKNDVYRPFILLLGDAGGLVDPLTGEGIYYAVKSGIMAASAVKEFLSTGREDKLKDYRTTIDSTFGKEFHWARVVGSFFFSLKGLNFSVISRSSGLTELVADLLSGRISYRDGFFRYLKLLPLALLRR